MTQHPIVRHAVHAMATRFEMVLWGLSPEALTGIAREAAQEIADLGTQLSAYDPAGDVWTVNETASLAPVRLDPRLFELLARCRDLNDLTDGAFDITVRPLLDLWGITTGTPSTPSPGEISAAGARCGRGCMALSRGDYSLRLADGARLDLGAVGKGYALDRAADVIRSYDVPGALLHGGTSTTQAIGTDPGGNTWRVAIADPGTPDSCLAVAHLADRALSVSAPHGKWLGEQETGYGHVLDPRTGHPCRGSLLAAVACPSATDSDALSTALLVQGPAGLPTIAALPHHQALLLTPDRSLHGGIA